jgi:hypothetical protein
MPLSAELLNPVDRGFTALEAALIEIAIPFAGAAADALARQFAEAEVVGRNFSGVGSFSSIKVPEECPLVLPHPPSPFSPAGARIGESGQLLSCILWFEEGRLACIELQLLDAPNGPIDLSSVQFAVEPVWPLQQNRPTIH